jgi:glucose-6-phosphate isomerase
MIDPKSLWTQFCQHRASIPSLGLTVDASRMDLDPGFVERMSPGLQRAFREMESLEKGAIANPDEKRMVGHYWLRASRLAPTPALAKEIEDSLSAVKRFAADVHSARVRPARADRFTRVLSIGIGGSALGPMFVSDALGDGSRDRMQVRFLDNTDPDGLLRVLNSAREGLGETLCLVTSKSGSTPEPRNAMVHARAAYEAAGLDFARHAAAVTQTGSQLDQEAQKWLARFPMWDWVGGRTSELSAVGLLPAALQGIDIDGLLEGARLCDEATRLPEFPANPAALMALGWFRATEGRGARDMVILPYKDRLLLLSRYLQQLVMESLGKRLDQAGKRVDQGITVYGNKGSTDQHAYIQQLRDGIPNFFATFIRILESGGAPLEVEPGVTAGDYLHGFLLGTREALYQNGRSSITLSAPRVDARTVGALIALFERTVGLYASLIGINAYHQPGVEAGKKAAAAVLALQGRVLGALAAAPKTAPEIAQGLGVSESVETVFALLEHLAANGRAEATSDPDPAKRAFSRFPRS